MKTLTTIIIAAVLYVFATPTFAKEITIWVTYPPGGTSGKTAIALQKRMSDYTNEEINIKYVPGAKGLLGTKKWFESTHNDDEINVLLNNDRVFIGPYLAKNLPENFANEIKPVGILGNANFVLHAVPSSNINKLEDLDNINKDTITLAVAGSGTAPHVFGLAMIKSMKDDLGIKKDVKLIHYPGDAKAIADLPGGHIDLVLTYPTVSKGFIDKGLTKAVAISGKVPGIIAPSFNELGLKNLPSDPTFALFVHSYVNEQDLFQVQSIIHKVFDDSKNFAEWEEQLQMINPTGSPEAVTDWYKKAYDFYKTASTDPAYSSMLLEEK